MNPFGKKIRELRKSADLSQRELAEKVDIDFTYLSKIEIGIMPPPSEDVIKKLAKVLNADEDELFALARKIPSAIKQSFSDPQKIALLRAIKDQKISKEQLKEIIKIAKKNVREK